MECQGLRYEADRYPLPKQNPIQAYGPHEGERGQVPVQYETRCILDHDYCLHDGFTECPGYGHCLITGGLV
jgi:hypothetical protein